MKGRSWPDSGKRLLQPWGWDFCPWEGAELQLVKKEQCGQAGARCWEQVKDHAAGCASVCLLQQPRRVFQQLPLRVLLTSHPTDLPSEQNRKCFSLQWEVIREGLNGKQWSNIYICHRYNVESAQPFWCHVNMSLLADSILFSCGRTTSSTSYAPSLVSLLSGLRGEEKFEFCIATHPIFRQPVEKEMHREWMGILPAVGLAPLCLAPVSEEQCSHGSKCSRSSGSFWLLLRACDVLVGSGAGVAVRRLGHWYLQCAAGGPARAAELTEAGRDPSAPSQQLRSNESFYAFFT